LVYQYFHITLNIFFPIGCISLYYKHTLSSICIYNSCH